MLRLAEFGTGNLICCVRQSMPAWVKRPLDMSGRLALIGVAIPIENWSYNEADQRRFCISAGFVEHDNHAIG